jgi:AraC-like DNA-binding protein
MPDPCKDLTKTREVLAQAIAWANRLDRLPLAMVCEDRTPFGIQPRPLLEFGFHAEGTETLIELGPLRGVSVPGTVLIVNGHFGYRGTPSGTLRICWVSFDVSQSIPAVGLGETPLLLTARAGAASAVLEAHRVALANCRRERAFAEVRLKGEVLAFLAALHESILEPGESALPRSPAVAAALEFMHRSYGRAGLRRRDLAEAAHLSEAHLARLFRQELGICPMRYLNRIRIGRARELLQRSRLNVEEVGRAVGLPNPFHFSRVFRAAEGASPRAYRRRT